jgi:hypothetical protein
MITPWSVRRIGALGDKTVELLPDMPDPLLNFSQHKPILAKSSKGHDDFRKAPVRFLPVLDCKKMVSLSRETRQRNPSHFGSYIQSGSTGKLSQPEPSSE